jgi:hypothetical protein
MRKLRNRQSPFAKEEVSPMNSINLKRKFALSAVTPGRMKNGSRLIAASSRRSFFGRTALAGGAILLGSAIPAKLSAEDNEGPPGICDLPVPIPHINIPPAGGAHFYSPGPVSGAVAPTDHSGSHPEGRDPSAIFNFKGFVGDGDFNLTGTGTDLETGATAPYTFHTDIRFMSGVFVGTDQIERHATFAFV